VVDLVGRVVDALVAGADGAGVTGPKEDDGEVARVGVVTLMKAAV
jgi:hypothetical protein